MLNLANILSILPFTVNVFGKKRDLVVKVGDLIYSQHRLKNLEIDNDKVDFSESDFFKIWAYATRNFERDFIQSDLGRFMSKELKPNAIFVDIGANLGGYSRLAKKQGAEVYLFEPVPALSGVLFENEHFFGKCYPVALSNESGEMPFHLSSSNIGGSSLVESNSESNSGYDGEVKVIVETFDTVFKEKIDLGVQFHLIKIDVEGNELKVVQGMQKALEKKLVYTIWCEVRGMSSDRNPGTYKSVSEYLKQFGFSAYQYKEGKAVPFDYLSVDDAPQFFDLMYIRDGLT